MSRVIAFGTDRQAYFDLFKESCKRYNIEPVILGWDEKWLGYGRKLIEIRNYLRCMPEDEIALIVDPFDVIFLCGLEEIENKFISIGSPFLCGALNLGKIAGFIYNYEFNKTNKKTPGTPTNYNYLNTGTWISRAGYAQFIIDELVEKYNMTDKSMDQQLLTGIYVQNLYPIDIDWKCEIFHNLLFRDFITLRADMKDLEFFDHRVINTASGTKPCILHASGNTKMSELALKLGYNPDILIPSNNAKNYTKKVFFHLGQLLNPQSSNGV
jgi:hypothetical protein